MILLDKLRESRKFEVVVGHITFSGVCPKYSRLSKVIADSKDDSADAKMASISITGWQGMTEADIIKGGDESISVTFDQELYEELIFDRRDWWVPIAQAVVNNATARQIVKEAEIKNSPAGMTPKVSKGSKSQRA